MSKYECNICKDTGITSNLFGIGTNCHHCSAGYQYLYNCIFAATDEVKLKLYNKYEDVIGVYLPTINQLKTFLI